MPPKKEITPNRGRGSGRGAQRAQTFQPMADRAKYRPQLGEFPKLVLPLGANGVRITHLDGIQFAEFHFPHKEGWVLAHDVPAMQAEAFSLKIYDLASSLSPPVRFDDAQNFVHDEVPSALYKTEEHPSNSEGKGKALAPRRVICPKSTDWWKSHLKPDIWRRIFPTRGSKDPSNSSNQDEEGTG